MKFEAWLAYTIGAGLCWGTYVPMIAFGGRELKSRYMAFLCVGVAYFLIAVLFPVVRFMLGWDKVGDLKATGLVFATLAGAAGAFGALGVIFATAAAEPGDRIYIAPLIFTLAPLLNTVVSLFWHPTTDHPFHVALPDQMPGWKLFLGIILVGAGAGLVLLSKEEAEASKSGAPKIPAIAPQSNQPS
jgi:hypothetical protein